MVEVEVEVHVDVDVEVDEDIRAAAAFSLPYLSVCIWGPKKGGRVARAGIDSYFSARELGFLFLCWNCWDMR